MSSRLKGILGGLALASVMFPPLGQALGREDAPALGAAGLQTPHADRGGDVLSPGALPIAETGPLEMPVMKDAANACTLTKAGIPSFYSNIYASGDVTVTYYDPVACGDTPTYPFKITSLDFTLFDHAGAVWPVLVDVVVYHMAVPGDTSGGPGAELCRSSVSG